MNDFIQLHVQGYQCTHGIVIQLAMAGGGGGGGGEKELGDDEMEPVATSCRRSDTEWQDCHR